VDFPTAASYSDSIAGSHQAEEASFDSTEVIEAVVAAVVAAHNTYVAESSADSTQPEQAAAAAAAEETQAWVAEAAPVASAAVMDQTQSVHSRTSESAPGHHCPSVRPRCCL